ncbi:unnamed protein product [Staurois parvus]|uniref:Uncharacterized protein n=1 Tax=Staurois parvus TaxID=386267 RepID=A0ABN9EAB4_9NEOB|nr:unnamed protein product [Staurois parvus]
MQTASTNICEKWVTLRISVNWGTVIGCYLRIKSICEISLLLNIPQ